MFEAASQGETLDLSIWKAGERYANWTWQDSKVRDCNSTEFRETEATAAFLSEPLVDFHFNVLMNLHRSVTANAASWAPSASYQFI